MSDAEMQGTTREKVGYGSPPVATRFQPGQSGNPAGKRPGTSFKTYLREEADKLDGDTPQLSRVAMTAMRLAIEGDIRAIAFVAERLDGKVPDRVEVSSAPQYPPADAQKAVADPVIAEMMCALDERLAAPEAAGDEPGGVRPQGEPGEVGVPAAPGAVEP